MDDCPMSEGRVLGGVARARQASKAHLRLQVNTLYARLRDLEGVIATREG